MSSATPRRAPMRFRCPDDTGGAEHLAFDVRLPTTVGDAFLWLSAAKCHCGKGMITCSEADALGGTPCGGA